ncbi:MAG: hypothetical protein B7L53_08680 [Thermofilum sp. NZ13]|nr:MAG: hypothetical protein B7L53_08680 [Thermofilum sp. NZ13]
MVNMSLKKVSAHVNKHFLEYTLLSLLAGFLIGVAFQAWISKNTTLIKNLIMAFAILTIYPSMIQLKGEELGKAAKKGKEMLISLVFVFVVAPLIAILFAYLLSDPQVALGYVASNIVPASSASISYVFLAEGDIELATVLAVISLLGSLVAIPGYLSAYASATSLNLPLDQIMMSVLYTLVVPFVAGQATRWILVYYKARAGGDKRSAYSWISQDLKPYTQLATMLSMLVLVALLVANESGLILKTPVLAVEVLLLQTVMLGFLLALITVIDKALGVSYEANTAIAYISATKNQSVAAMIAVMALGPKAALVPALVPAIQAPVSISYLRVLPRLRKWFKTEK